MSSRLKSSNLSETILRRRKLEKTFLENQFLSIDRERKKIRLTSARHMETFLQSTQKRHETWYRYDKYFRDALKKEKDRHEKRKEHNGSSRHLDANRSTALITLYSRPEPMTKVEQQTYKVLHASQKLLDESAIRTKSNFDRSRPITSTSSRRSSSIGTRGSLYTFNNSSFIIPMTESLDYEDYTRLMGESLKNDTYADFVDHFVKFCPEYRDKFVQFNQANKRQIAVEKLREFNQSFTKAKDQRYHNLVNSLIDFRSKKK